jgi:tetratricopeptide (TPR) repeat protein
MLSEALTVRRPFNESNPIRLLQEKQERDAPSIVGEENIPDDLATLCMQLLVRDPEQRPDTLEIAKAISAGTVAEAPAPSSDHPLVGRELKLAALKDAHDTFLKERQPLTVYVAGRSGEGKTSLAEQHLQPIRKDPRVTVLSGRCYDRESVPFKALDSLIDALASFLRSLPETATALMLPDDITILSQVFPALERVGVVAQAPRAKSTDLDDQQVRTRAFAALRSLLWRIGERKPMVWFVDDLQWGDTDSAEALFEVLRPPSAPAILFIGIYRSDEAETSRFLKTWEVLQAKHGVDIERRDVSVGPLSIEDCTELVRSLLGQSNETIDRRAAEFASETGGNPFLLIELLGCFDPATDSLRPVPMHEAIDEKLERLPPEARRLLDVIAVSGQAISLEETSSAAGHDTTAIATFTHMRNERLIRLIGTDERPMLDTYHDRIRSSVLDQCLVFCASGLRRLGIWVPRTRFGFGCAVLRELMIQCGHSLVPGRLHRKPPTTQANLVIDLFISLQKPFAFQNILKMLWAHVAGMNRAELLPPALPLVTSHAFHGMLMSMMGWHKRGARYGDRAMALALELEDLWGKGIGRNHRGVGMVASARYEESLSHLAAATEIFDKAGDLWEVNLAQFHRSCCQYGLGNLSDAIIEVRSTFDSSVRIGDSRILCSSYLWARAARGNSPFEELKSCYPDRPDDVMSTVHGIMAEGHWHTFHGRTDEALETFERASNLVWKNFCVNSHMILVMPVLAAALRRHADAVQSANPQEADRLRKRGFRTAKWAARITRLFPAAHAESLREMSLQLEAKGKTKKALRVVDRSCAVAERQGEKYEHAQSLLVRGKLARELGLPEAEQQIQTAEVALETFERMMQEASNNPIVANPSIGESPTSK